MTASQSDITRLLTDAKGGDSKAATALFPMVYSSLRELARRHMTGEREWHTLQPTALVHETYLKLIGGSVAFNGTEHFLRAAAEAMRRILIDHAKARGRTKRGSGRKAVELKDYHLAIETRQEDILTIDEAICRLKEVDPDAASLVQMRFYIGLRIDEVAEARGVSVSTIQREWAFARAFLYRALAEND